MHNLIVISHPVPGSLTHSVATEVRSGIMAADPKATVETADLHAEGFDPMFTARDAGVNLQTATPAEDVIAEQQRIDRAGRLILVYPVYWWSFPALLKGWIDRVFTNGWAYGSDPTGAGLVKMLRRLDVALVAVAGTDAGTYARHGYAEAMRTQIDHGIFDYCGARVVRHDWLFETHGPDQQPNLAAARAIGGEMVA